MPIEFFISALVTLLVVVDPVGGDLSEPALRSLRWGGRFVTVGYASGVVPRIPPNLVLLKGVHVPGFQFSDFHTHAPEAPDSNETELPEILPAGRAGRQGGIFSGTGRVQFTDRAVEYNSVDDRRKALADIDSAIATASGATPSSFSLAMHSRD